MLTQNNPYLFLTNRLTALVQETEKLESMTSNLKTKRQQLQQLFVKTNAALETIGELTTLLPQTSPEIRASLEALFEQEEFPLTPSTQETVSPSELLMGVAYQLLPRIQQGIQITNSLLASEMSKAFQGSDAEGKWLWKDAYECLEIAQILLVQEQGAKLLQPSQLILEELEKIHRLCPTQTKRSEESLQLQQFSTPLPLAYLTGIAAAINSEDIVLESSAGTGMLAAFARVSGAQLVLNEICAKRRSILKQLFPESPLFDHNAEQIDDYLASEYLPTVVVMNPPFSASVKMGKRNQWATLKHLSSALARLSPGGRLVAITANWFSPLHPEWQEEFSRLQRSAQVVFSVGIEGNAYAKHGTTIDTRLTVFDKIAADKPEEFRHCSGDLLPLAEVLAMLEKLLPARQTLTRSDLHPQNQQLVLMLPQPEKVLLGEVASTLTSQNRKPQGKSVTGAIAVKLASQSEPTPKRSLPWGNVVEIEYITRNWSVRGEINEGLYKAYEPQSIVIKGAKEHPASLVESAAMSSVAPPRPSYHPQLPQHLVNQGILSQVQLESVIYAGESHSQFLKGYYQVDDNLDQVTVAPPKSEEAVRFRRGYFIGHSTGVGKGRQVSAILLDNYLKGSKKAFWSDWKKGVTPLISKALCHKLKGSKSILPEKDLIPHLQELTEDDVEMELKTVFYELDRRGKPLLLIFDDFEWNLEPQEDGSYTIKTDPARVLQAVIEAVLNTNHKIIITCRYNKFDSDSCILPHFYPQGLEPLSKSDLAKLLRRLENFNSDRIDVRLQERAKEVAAGNPRLLEELNTVLGKSAAVAQRELEEYEKDPNKKDSIIWRELYDQIKKDSELEAVLGCGLVYRIPVPKNILIEVCGETIEKGITLGLIAESSEREEENRLYRVSPILPKTISSIHLPVDEQELLSLYRKAYSLLSSLWGNEENENEERWAEIFHLAFADNENPDRFREQFDKMISVQYNKKADRSYEKELRKHKEYLEVNKGQIYQKLEKYLQQQDWKKADYETAFIMYQWMVIENYLDSYYLFRNIPLDVIDEIDRLWMNHSEGKFGIKGQAKIYRDLGGTEDYCRSEEVWESFGDHVGWREGGRWLELEEVTYHATTQPKNHLPVLMYSRVGLVRLGARFGWLDIGGWWRRGAAAYGAGLGFLLSRQDLRDCSTDAYGFLNELGKEIKRSLAVWVIKLVIESEEEAVPQAKALIEQTRNQLSDSQLQQQLIDLVERIVVYKFPQKSREEIEAMFELSDLKQTRVYQEALAEGEVRGEVKLLLRLINRAFGEIPQNLTEQIRALSVEEIENLGEALLDFQHLSDLVSWLER